MIVNMIIPAIIFIAGIALIKISRQEKYNSELYAWWIPSGKHRQKIERICALVIGVLAVLSGAIGFFYNLYKITMR